MRGEDIPLLKAAGADELYCGYITEELAKRWPVAFGIVNRRGEDQSFEDYGVFKKAVARARRCGLPVYVTVNGLYTPEQYPFLLDLAAQLESLDGVKGIIVADVGFLLTLRKNGFKKEIHISTGATTFNSRTIDFFRGIGAKRIVLDRQLSPAEMEDVIAGAGRGIDIELFVIGGGCGGFIDGYCTFFHCFERKRAEEMEKGVFLSPTFNVEQAKKGCDFYHRELSEGNFKVLSAPTHKEIKTGLKFDAVKNKLLGCRICDLHALNKPPVKTLKIVGRGKDTQYLVTAVTFIATVASWLRAGDISKREYQRKCRDLFSKTFQDNRKRCTKFDCYFSDHWVKDEQ